MNIDEIARIIGLMVMTFGGIGAVFTSILWMCDKFALLKFSMRGIKTEYREMQKKKYGETK